MRKMKKRICSILLMTLVLLCLQGCGEEKQKEIAVAGKVYTYTGEEQSEFEMDKFTITIFEDGTFSYYETLISSYIGFGQWTLEGDILTLEDDPQVCYYRINRFKVDGDDLVFIEDGSSNFLYKKVKDGERFSGAVLTDEIEQLVTEEE